MSENKPDHNTIKIIIADDHPVIRHGLTRILAADPGIKVVGEAGNAQEVYALVRTVDCDVVILDITMPGSSGVDVLKQLKYGYPDLPVLILSIHPEEQYALRVIRAGASGYMTKENSPDELIKAVRKVASGGKYISQSLAEKLFCDLDATGNPLHHRLSDREFQIMYMIASGKSVKAISTELSLSSKTVSTYRARIFEKMRMKSNIDLIRYAISSGLLE